MDKQAQDERWNRLSEREQAGWLENYKCNKEDGSKESMKIIEELFGFHNLNPKTQIKTWKDVEKEYPEHFSRSNAPNPLLLQSAELRDKLLKKTMATYKIATLIELGYGGMVSEEEWKDDDIKKYCVIIDNGKIDKAFDMITIKQFIAFHTPEQREEFMSYESNRQLVKQYYMMRLWKRSGNIKRK